MKREKISQALGNISSRHIEEAIRFGTKEETNHSPRPWIKWGTLIAACFALIILIIPLINRFGLNAPLQNVTDHTSQNGDITENTQNNKPGTNTLPNGDGNNKPGTNTSPDDPLDNMPGQNTQPGDVGQDNPGQDAPGSLPPISVEYGSIEEAHDAIKYNTLYSKIVLDEFGFSDITTIFPSSSGAEILLSKPRELLIHTSYDNGGTIDMVDYYVLFDKESVDESYIGGYVEQGLTKEINGVTVHYCLFESNGRMHGQAKFLYDGNLYVIDVKTNGDTYNLDTYVDMVLK